MTKHWELSEKGDPFLKSFFLYLADCSDIVGFLDDTKDTLLSGYDTSSSSLLLSESELSK